MYNGLQLISSGEEELCSNVIEIIETEEGKVSLDTRERTGRRLAGDRGRGMEAHRACNNHLCQWLHGLHSCALTHTRGGGEVCDLLWQHEIRRQFAEA